VRKLTLATLLVLSTLRVAAADPARQREVYVTWLDDRYTESWSWLLRDATVEDGGTTWRLAVEVQVRDRGRPVREPTARFTLTAPAPQTGYPVCPEVGLIADGVAIQDVVSRWTYHTDHGAALKSVTFTVPLAAFRRIAGARTLEARLCTEELALEPSVLTALRGYAAKVRSGAPPAAARQRYRDEQRLRDFADNWRPREELRSAWHSIAGDEVITFAAGASAQTFRVASSKCGKGLLAKMTGADTPALVAAGFRRVECVGGSGAESLDL
jgi:hypothetical protein